VSCSQTVAYAACSRIEHTDGSGDEAIPKSRMLHCLAFSAIRYHSIWSRASLSPIVSGKMPEILAEFARQLHD